MELLLIRTLIIFFRQPYLFDHNGDPKFAKQDANLIGDLWVYHGTLSVLQTKSAAMAKFNKVEFVWLSLH